MFVLFLFFTWQERTNGLIDVVIWIIICKSQLFPVFIEYIEISTKF